MAVEARGASDRFCELMASTNVFSLRQLRFW
jgi:hypothetical protein